MISIKVTFEDGNVVYTNINTDFEGAKAYYLGKCFSLFGKEALAVKVETVSGEYLSATYKYLSTTYKEQMNYSVTKTEAKKVTITISRKQLWMNFVECWKDMAWDDYCGVLSLEEVADVLLSGSELDVDQLRKLFQDGHTVFLLNDAMPEIDVSDKSDILREIVVQDEGKLIKIRHEDIIF